jgi:hypothetical protein
MEPYRTTFKVHLDIAINPAASAAAKRPFAALATALCLMIVFPRTMGLTPYAAH